MLARVGTCSFNPGILFVPWSICRPLPSLVNSKHPKLRSPGLGHIGDVDATRYDGSTENQLVQLEEMGVPYILGISSAWT